MKILLVNKFLFPNGGSETYIFKLGEALQGMGNEVQYFGMEHPGRIVGNHAESYTASMDFHTGKLQRLIYPFKILYSREARGKIRKVLDDFEPDIVHLNNFNFQITPSVIYEIRKWEKESGRTVGIVFTAHDYQWVCPNHMMYIPQSQEKCFQCEGGKFANCVKNKCIHHSKIKSILGMLEAKLYWRLKTYGKVDKVICPSQFMKDKLATNPVLREKLCVLYNFIDRKEVADVSQKGYVLYFGRYSQEKGIHTLVRVCEGLPRIPFVFAGRGPLEKEIEQVENIKNVGFVEGEELAQLIMEADFSIYPSEWYENCPFSVMESIAYQTPVLGAEIGGIPELICQGETGELFKSGDEADLSAKIKSMWENRDKLAEYTDKCRQKQFDDAQQYCRKLIDLYLESLGDGFQNR